MSQENVEVARRAYEAYNRGDLEGMVVDFAPTFAYETTGAVPGTRAVYNGPNGWSEFAGWIREEFYDARIEIHDLIEAGDQVLAEVTLKGRGKQSGVETSWDLWHLWTVQEGKVVHGHGFTRRDEALEAAGLSE
ncbi:MAG: nuclear transport factor 2 family protein [Gemmatimonadota bacterium]